MGTFGSGERYDDNPFVFFASDEYIINPQQRQEMPNPLRAMYEDLAPLLLRSPPSKRYPQQPTGMKEWDILTDPISGIGFHISRSRPRNRTDTSKSHATYGGRERGISDSSEHSCGLFGFDG